MLPKSMKAVRIFEYGDPTVLQYLEAQLPEMGEEDVLKKSGATKSFNSEVFKKSSTRPSTE